jgi:hypothetical protein
MDEIASLIPKLWAMAKDHTKFNVNLISKDDEITISILKGKRWKRFKNKDTDKLLEDIEQSLLLA